MWYSERATLYPFLHYVIKSYPHFRAFVGRKSSGPRSTLLGRPSNPAMILISVCQWQLSEKPSQRSRNTQHCATAEETTQKGRPKTTPDRILRFLFNTMCARSINYIIPNLIPIPAALQSDSRGQQSTSVELALPPTSIHEALVVQRVTGTFGT